MIRPQTEVTRTQTLLRARAGAFLLLLAVACTSLLVAAEALLVGMTSSLEKPGEGLWLLAVDRNDPRLEDELGQAYKEINPTESILHLRRATRLSPASRLYWSDLESACESVGDMQCADQARERLLQLCPMVPAYHWLVADSCLRSNRPAMALEHFRRLLELDPAYALPVWSALQSVLQPEPVFQEVLADNPDAKLKVGYVDFLSAEGDNDAALRIWRQVVARSPSFPFSSAAPYLDRLIDTGRIEEAVNVWQDLMRLGIVAQPGVSPALAASPPARAGSGKTFQGGAARDETPELSKEGSNLIFNGDFERSPLNAGFDWRTGSTTYLVVDFSASGAYRGAHCLRVDFTVSRNDEYEPVYQIVPVLPRHAYRLEAFVRSQDITSDTGPSLRVRDTQPAGSLDAVSETLVGTTPWHLVRVSFRTGPQTRAVRISFWRPRSRVFPTEISGTSWLDAVSLRSEPDQ